MNAPVSKAPHKLANYYFIPKLIPLIHFKEKRVSCISLEKFCDLNIPSVKVNQIRSHVCSKKTSEGDVYVTRDRDIRYMWTVRNKAELWSRDDVRPS